MHNDLKPPDCSFWNPCR